MQDDRPDFILAELAEDSNPKDYCAFPRTKEEECKFLFWLSCNYPEYLVRRPAKAYEMDHFFQKHDSEKYLLEGTQFMWNGLLKDGVFDQDKKEMVFWKPETPMSSHPITVKYVEENKIEGLEKLDLRADNVTDWVDLVKLSNADEAQYLAVIDGKAVFFSVYH